MGLKCGIVGLPNVGKSTLFNALTSAGALAANYPFATKEPNIGIITVPDSRLSTLAALAKSVNVVPTTVEILDIAGLIKGASQGEGLGNQFLANIREVDAIIHVIRCFEDENVVHVDGDVNPVRDKEIIDAELILKDIETTEKRLDRLAKLAKTGKKEDLANVAFIQSVITHLEQGNPGRSFEVDDQFKTLWSELLLLTAKPVLYICNVDELSVAAGNHFVDAFLNAVSAETEDVLLVSAAIESDIAELEEESERIEFVREMGLEEPGVNRVIRASYEMLNLITFFTVGPKESRAWTVTIGTKAPQAAGEIHTDFEKGFIRAEVIQYEDYLSMGSEQAVKEAGKMSVEGKEYVVKDADVIYFRFNV